MFSFTKTDHPATLQNLKEIKEQNKLNIDEYMKFKKPLTPIQSFYAGKSIFLTGATGFLGICAVEKLLRDCSDIKKLYLLVRSNNRISIENKIKKYYSNVAFDRLRKINPNFEEKIVIVNGDLCEKDLGLSAEDRQLLIDDVNIMIHNGATVKFKEVISVALKINVLGTKAMLDLALACKHMKAFVYVSTAYSHNYRKYVKEEFYEPAADLKIVHDMIVADQMAKNGLSEDATNMLLGKWINIYTFAKSISEDLVRQYGEKASFACSVFRPSMVYSAYKEPLIGWCGNKNGPIGISVGIGLGIVHVLADKKEPFDLVPVDFSINALIACTYDAAEEWESEKRPRVYNFGSSAANCLTIRRMYNEAHATITTIGLEQGLWHMSLILAGNKWSFLMLHIFLHCIPAAFTDVALLLMRKKPRALSICISATKHLDWVVFFTTFGWRIHVTETRKVFDKISEVDRQLFDFDIWKLNWEKYISKAVIGSKFFLLKESLDNIEKSKRRTVLLKNIHFTFLTIFYLMVGYYVMRLFSIIN